MSVHNNYQLINCSQQETGRASFLKNNIGNLAKVALTTLIALEVLGAGIITGHFLLVSATTALAFGGYKLYSSRKSGEKPVATVIKPPLALAPEITPDQSVPSQDEAVKSNKDTTTNTKGSLVQKYALPAAIFAAPITAVAIIAYLMLKGDSERTNFSTAIATIERQPFCRPEEAPQYCWVDTCPILYPEQYCWADTCPTLYPGTDEGIAMAFEPKELPTCSDSLESKFYEGVSSAVTYLSNMASSVLSWSIPVPVTSSRNEGLRPRKETIIIATYKIIPNLPSHLNDTRINEGFCRLKDAPPAASMNEGLRRSYFNTEIRNVSQPLASNNPGASPFISSNEELASGINTIIL
ncbi:MAG: hypothetical protein WAM28_06630, partial [Chlamydiales bacterium]